MLKDVIGTRFKSVFGVRGGCAARLNVIEATHSKRLSLKALDSSHRPTSCLPHSERQDDTGLAESDMIKIAARECKKLGWIWKPIMQYG